MVTDSIGLAAHAARSVNLHDGAFGVLCSFIPPFLNRTEVAVGDAVAAAGETVAAAADGVVAMSRDYQAADDRAHERLSALRRAVE